MSIKGHGKTKIRYLNEIVSDNENYFINYPKVRLIILD